MDAPAYIGADAAAEVYMSHEMRAKAILLVEGICEVRLIAHHYPDCEKQVVACGGHLGVKEAIEAIEEWEEINGTKLKILGFVDRDYGCRSTCRRITVTNNRDIEIDMYVTQAGERILREKASRKKCPDPRGAISSVMEELAFVGMIRMYNSQNGLNWSINGVNLEKCLDADGLLDRDKFFGQCAQLNGLSQDEQKKLKQYLDSNPTLRKESILRGHDVSVVIGKWLRKRIGSRCAAETSWACIEENLRLASSLEELLKYNWARRIKSHLGRV